MTATWTKLKDGSWGIRCVGKATAGLTVHVTKKDGTVQAKTVGKVFWTGPDAKTGQTVSLCSVIDSKPAAAASQPSSAPRRNWRPCGYPGCHPSYCDECDGLGWGH